MAAYHREIPILGVSSVEFDLSGFRFALRHLAGTLLIGFTFTRHQRLVSCGHDADAEMDLSRSILYCIYIPISLHRLSLALVTSKIFAPSMAFSATIKTWFLLFGRTNDACRTPHLLTVCLLAAHIYNVVIGLRLHISPYAIY